MRRILFAAALALLGAAGACAPHPIVARDPVPAPSPDEAYSCDSSPIVLNNFRVNCAPVQRESRPLVRAKG